MTHTYSLRIVVLLLLLHIGASAQVKGIETIGFTVKEMERSIHFYTEALGFKKISENEYEGNAFEKLKSVFGLHMRVVTLQLGDETIELTDYLTAGGRNIPENFKSNDLAFQHIAIVVSDMDKAYQQLRKYHVEFVSTAPQTLPVSNTAAAGIRAFYFHDPDGHHLELIYFPKGKGREKWQNSRGKIFLGIDHTAIGVSSTPQSLSFYQTLLGIEKKGESFNMGTEQEHLNNVEGASLHITGLRAATGPGIEFLEYLKPGPGKPFPADTRADDIWYWQIVLVATDVEKLYARLKQSGVPFVSKGLTQLNIENGVAGKAFIVRDPDGHALLITGG